VNRDQDRRALMAVVLSLGVWMVWTTFFAPEPPPPVPEGETPELTDGGTPAAGSAVPVAPSVAPAAVRPAASERVPFRVAPISGEGWSGEVASTSGSIRSLSLTDYSSPHTVMPLYRWVIDKVSGNSEGGWEPYTGGDTPQELLSEEGALLIAGAGPLDDDGGVEEADSVYTVSQAGGVVTARRVRPDGLGITKTYAVGEVAHTLDVTVTFDNQSGGSMSPWVGVADRMSGEAGRFSNAARPVAHADGSVEHIDDLEDLEGEDSETLDGTVEWFGVGNRYFFAVLIGEDASEAAGDAEPDKTSTVGNLLIDELPSGRIGIVQLGAPLAAGASRTHHYTVYSGPKSLDALKALGHELEEAVEYGWFGFFSKILLFILKTFQLGVVNWGLAIISLTVLVKLLFFPLTQKSFESSRRMQALQPKLNAMKEKFKDNKEIQTQETMKLFKENKVNPMGGCLPTLIQFPVWIALYNVMLYTVELYGTEFLYIQDLTEADPYGIIPTLYALLMFGQQRMMPTSSLDETQQKVIKMMPLIFAFFMYSFPSGLVLYFCVNMMLTILQQWFIKRKFPDVPVEAAATTQ
jgi:YidC/Oxa1 family membrane protein insertase